jgi:SAM-dependent methyltransferase
LPLPFNLVETIGLSMTTRGPGPMADLLGVLSFKAIITAIRLDIFEILGQGNSSLQQLSRAAGADAAGLSYLIGLLENLGYLKRSRGKISNTAMTRKWMLKDSPCAMTDLFPSINDASTRWDYLVDSIRSGRPPLPANEWLDGDEARWATYHRGLKSTARLISPAIVKNVKIPGHYRTLLDLGGGHGHYCIEFCKKYPGLRGTIFDWEPAGPVASQNIREAGLDDRVTFQPGDFLSDHIGSGFDVILLFNIIRILDADALRALLQKVSGALARDGMIVILDHMGYSPSSRFMSANALLILLEIFNSTMGRIHNAADVSALLREIGSTRIRKKDLPRSPGLTLIKAGAFRDRPSSV